MLPSRQEESGAKLGTYIRLHASSFPTITSSAGVKLLSTLTYSPQLLLLGESPGRKEREEEETDQ